MSDDLKLLLFLAKKVIERQKSEIAAYKALLARHNALVEAVGKVVEMHRKGEGHVCTHYPSGRRALEALAALVGEERE